MLLNIYIFHFCCNDCHGDTNKTWDSSFFHLIDMIVSTWNSIKLQQCLVKFLLGYTHLCLSAVVNFILIHTNIPQGPLTVVCPLWRVYRCCRQYHHWICQWYVLVLYGQTYLLYFLPYLKLTNNQIKSSNWLPFGKAFVRVVWRDG